MAGRLKDTPRKSTQSAAAYAGEIADLLVRYEAAALTDWRMQDGIWKEIRKKLQQYKIAKKREEKEQTRKLWEAEKERKITAAREKAARAKSDKQRTRSTSTASSPTSD